MAALLARRSSDEHVHAILLHGLTSFFRRRISSRSYTRDVHSFMGLSFLRFLAGWMERPRVMKKQPVPVSVLTLIPELIL